MALTEERKGQIALAAKKVEMRKELAFRDIANVKRSIGNLVKDPEMVVINATSKELLELAKSLLEEIFAEQMKTVA